jgi:hypothetical protein
VSAAREEEDVPVVEPALAELDLVVLVAATFLLDALPLEPHAATPTAAASATSVTSAALDKRFAFLMVSVGPFRLKSLCGGAHPPPKSELTAELALPVLELELEPVDDELPVLLAPESVTDVAAMVPLEPLAPAITTWSPGLSFLALTVSLLEILVAPDSFTLTVLPEVSVT